jgi:hypothetical protein
LKLQAKGRFSETFYSFIKKAFICVTHINSSRIISGVQCSAEVSLLFTGELNPVATKAQRKVPIPEG